jgi:hypothetical protein
MRHLQIFIIVISIFFTKNMAAQSDYFLAVGVRAGNPLAVDGKYYFADAHAVQAIVGLQYPRGWGLTGLYQYNGDFNWRGEMNWFVGAGGSMMLNRDDIFSVGADLILGIEYTFPTLPLNFALDWKPCYSNFPQNQLQLDQAAITLRYALK